MSSMDIIGCVADLRRVGGGNCLPGRGGGRMWREAGKATRRTEVTERFGKRTARETLEPKRTIYKKTENRIEQLTH